MKTSILIAIALVSSTSAIKVDDKHSGIGNFIRDHNFDQTKEQGHVGDFLNRHNFVQDKAAGFSASNFIKEHNFV